MPMYEVEHVAPLSPSQQDALATAITTIHTQLFTTPSLFVNVKFTDVSTQVIYVAGKRRSTNRILATVRHGPTRTQTIYKTLCTSLLKSWSDVVGSNEPSRALQLIQIRGSLVAGMESGFMRPEPGQDKAWLRENMGEFRRLAEAGDEDFVALVEEVRRREDLRGLLEDEGDGEGEQVEERNGIVDVLH